MRGICPKRIDLVLMLKSLDWFKERGYPEDMVNNEAKRTLEISLLGRSKNLKEVSLAMVELGYL